MRLRFAAAMASTLLLAGTPTTCQTTQLTPDQIAVIVQDTCGLVLSAATIAALIPQISAIGLSAQLIGAAVCKIALPAKGRMGLSPGHQDIVLGVYKGVVIRGHFIR